MTSIKSVISTTVCWLILTHSRQNQDLSKELATAQAELSRLRTFVTGEKASVPNHQPDVSHLPGPDLHQLPSHNLSHLPTLNSPSSPPPASAHALYDPPVKRQKTDAFEDLPKIGINIARFGQGIFKPPIQCSDPHHLWQHHLLSQDCRRKTLPMFSFDNIATPSTRRCPCSTGQGSGSSTKVSIATDHYITFHASGVRSFSLFLPVGRCTVPGRRGKSILKCLDLSSTFGPRI